MHWYGESANAYLDGLMKLACIADLLAAEEFAKLTESKGRDLPNASSDATKKCAECQAIYHHRGLGHGRPSAGMNVAPCVALQKGPVSECSP